LFLAPRGAGDHGGCLDGRGSGPRQFSGLIEAMSERPIFNVAQLLREPAGSSRRGQIDVTLPDLISDPKSAAEAKGLPQFALVGSVRLMHVTNGVLVEGDLEADVDLQCARCLEPVMVDLDIPVEEIFTPTMDVISGQAIRPEEEDQALWINEHHILDLSEVLRQDVLIALPLHVLCRSDCRGLCPNCGQNLNEGPCDCTVEPDPRWAQLAELLRDDENHKSEKE
jgi:uncharacterized protein